MHGKLDKIYAKLDAFGADINALNDQAANDAKLAREKEEADKAALAEIEANKQAKAKAKAKALAKEKKEREAKERAIKAAAIKKAEEAAAWELKRQQKALAEAKDPAKLKEIKAKILAQKVEVEIQKKEQYYADWEANEQTKINKMYQKRQEDMNKFWESAHTRMQKLHDQATNIEESYYKLQENLRSNQAAAGRLTKKNAIAKNEAAITKIQGRLEDLNASRKKQQESMQTAQEQQMQYQRKLEKENMTQELEMRKGRKEDVSNELAQLVK